MGSPASRLGVPEKLRPWHCMGVEFFLNPCGTEKDQRTTSISEPTMASASAALGSAPAPQEHSAVAREVPASYGSRNAQASKEQQGDAVVQHPPRSSSGPLQAPWDRFASLARGAKPKVLLTYPELGFDLTGQADPARGQLMRTLLGYLKWPKGTAAFWPCALSVNGTLQPQYEMFWRGVHHFACPRVVCFGAHTAQMIAPGFPAGTETMLFEPCSVHVVPPVEELLGKLPHELLFSVASLSKISFS